MYNARFMTEEEVTQQVANSALNNAERFFPMLSRHQLANMFGRLERETHKGWYQLMMCLAPAHKQLGKVFEDILNNTTRNLVGVLIVSDTPDDIVVPLTSKNSVHMFDYWDCRFLPITKEIFDDVQENEYDA